MADSESSPSNLGVKAPLLLSHRVVCIQLQEAQRECGGSLLMSPKSCPRNGVPICMG